MAGNKLALNMPSSPLDRYLPATESPVAVFNPATNRINLYRSNSLVLGWARTWTDTVRTNFAYGGTRITNNFNAIHDALGDRILDNRKLDQGFANVFWGVTKNTELGLEYQWGDRVTHTDPAAGRSFSGRNSRIQASAQYNF